MATLRELKGRIGSVASSEKITGAMKMISSAKMHKAEAALRQLQPFRHQIETIIGNLLSADTRFSSPLIEHRDVRRVAVVVFGSDDGLCGAYNVNIYKKLVAHLQDLQTRYAGPVEFDIYPVGKKIEKSVSKMTGFTVRIISSGDIDSKSDGDKVKAFMKSVEDDYINGTFDKVDIVYMNYRSVSRQVPVAEQLLPVIQESFCAAEDKASGRPYIFEPDADAIFTSVLPMFLLAVMQDVFTENRASEQAARVMAMQSANDNAKKLLEQLQLEYNKLRQQSITTELLDIVGGQVRD